MRHTLEEAFKFFSRAIDGREAPETEKARRAYAKVMKALDDLDPETAIATLLTATTAIACTLPSVSYRRGTVINALGDELRNRLKKYLPMRGADAARAGNASPAE